MSNRDSMGFGDLIPQDVVDIFAHEKHSKRGRKKRSHSLGRALGWLKGKKRKDQGAKGQGLGLGPALDLAVDGHPAGHQGGHKGGPKSANPKRHEDDKTLAPPLIQENVFIEASRPKYLENLHSEALEGLKMMQQEETKNGVEFHDNESTISTMTIHTDGEGGGFMTDSTIADSTSVVSVQSSVSTRSSRSGLTRQGSTFRPLNSGKKSEKAKTRRRQRKTVAGIPQHVQKELGLDRAGWILTQTIDEKQLYNGETDDSPTTDGPQQPAESQVEASAGLQEVNSIQPLNKAQLEQLGASHAGHRDDLALLHYLGPDLSGEQRPHSLAVPWMTTANSLQPELPSPVITTSPQAAYMSKIIPNAVLPPSIEVVEISRGRSRNSVRTVSKSSLLLSSPAPSRASSRASSSRTTSSRASKITSVSQQNPHIMSDSSCWSNSESSETLVSDSSTISSSSTPRQKRSQDEDGSAREDKISVHSSISKASKYTSNGKLVIRGDKVQKDGQFVRSLSVMKPKRAPPPPSRSYSLHNKMKRRSRDLAEVRIIPGESSLHSISASGEENEKNKSGSSPVSSRIIDSPGYNADTSSLDDSSASVLFSPTRSKLQAAAEETVSKDASQVKKGAQQESKQSKVVSPSSGYSSQEGTSAQLSKESHSSSPRHKRGILAKLQRLFPGSTPAASTATPLTQPEAPENTKDVKPDMSVDTSSVSPSVRTLRDLFNIPPPPKVRAPPPPPPEVWAHSKRSFELLLGPPAPDNIQAIIKKNPKDRRQQRKSPCASTEGSVKSLAIERKHKNQTITVESMNGSLNVLETKKVQESVILNAEIHRENNDRLAEQYVDLNGNRKVTEKDEKVRVSDILNGMLVKATERNEERLKEDTIKTSIQASEEHTSPGISLVHISPSPPQPQTKQTTEFASVPPVQVVSPETFWPPPPPPMGLSGTDEIDFPLPPPPMFGEEGVVIPVQLPPETSSTTTSVSSVTNTESVRVTTEAEPQKPSTSQGIVPPPLNIPPPPPYTAPPPPVEAVPPPTFKKVSPPPPPIAFSLPPLLEVSLPSPKENSPPPPKEVSPPPPKEVSPPPPKEVSSPPPKEVSPPPPKVSPPPPKEVSPPPPKEVSPPPPKVSPPPSKEISPPPPKEVSPPPPKEVSPLPSKEVSPLPSKEVSPPASKEVSRPPPIEISLPPLREVFPLPSKEVPAPPPEEVSLPPPIEISPPPPKDVSPPPPVELSLPPTKEISPRLVITVNPLPPDEVPTLSSEEVSPPSPKEDAHQPSEEETPVSKLTPPQSIPPPPPLPSQNELSGQEIDVPHENGPPESEANTVLFNSILTPPQSIPPPPPIQLPTAVTPSADTPATQEASESPPSEDSITSALKNSLSTERAEEPVASPPVNIPLPPPLPAQGLASIKHQPSPPKTENQPPEVTSVPVVQEDLSPIVTPSLLQTVKLRSVNSSPEPPKAHEQPEDEVTMRNQQPSNPTPTSSASGEAPQKPIRRSLIMTAPTPSSPPAVVTSQPALPKSQSLVIPTTSSSTVLSPTKKSPPTMAAAPSMNLQEAIRLRTAARSKTGPASRLSLHSPTSPSDLHKSPSSTASFIFSKSNKKVVIETKQAPETHTVSTVTKVGTEAESVKKAVKVPPPVAKKPKAKGKETENSEGTEQTAGQEALESVKDAEEKTNGTAGTVEGGATPLT